MSYSRWMAGHFVGRVAELETIARAIDAALHGKTHVVLVGGDPGQGKTRLLEEASAAVSATRIWVRGYELERNVPFAAASELFSSLRSDGATPLDDLLSGESRARPRGRGAASSVRGDPPRPA